MKNILITGGAGFIGSNLAQKLLTEGFNVRVLDNLSKQIHGEKPEETSSLYLSIKDKVEFIKGDVTDRAIMEKCIQGQDAIIHLAAETGTGQSMYEIKRYCDVNTGGTALMLDILANKVKTVQKIIIASSRAIYGEGKYQCGIHGVVYPEMRNSELMQSGDFNCKCPICNSNVSVLATSEDSPAKPNSIYGITKFNQEQLVMLAGKSLSIPAVSFRFQNVYGPGQSLSNPYTGILSIFSNLILKGKEINIFEDGMESRDFIYIDDIVNAIYLGLIKEEANNQIFNVGTAIATTVKELTEVLTKCYNANTSYRVSGQFRVGDIRHNFADTTLIHSRLDYTPKVSLFEGITRFSEWVKTLELPNLDFSKSIDELKKRSLFK